MHMMNSGIENQGIQIRKQRFDEILSDSRLPRFVKPSPFFKINRRIIENDDCHKAEARKRLLSCSSVRNFASPLSTRAFLSASTV